MIISICSTQLPVTQTALYYFHFERCQDNEMKVLSDVLMIWGFPNRFRNQDLFLETYS